jgi:hypothetical protein
MDDDLRKRLLAIEVLLQEPEDTSDALETELYALRDRLQPPHWPSRMHGGRSQRKRVALSRL